jgi:glycine/sarcosine N-methyltransferase
MGRDATPADFYDELADDYHLIFADWDAAIGRQADVIGALLRDNGLTRGRVLDDHLPRPVSRRALRRLAARGVRDHLVADAGTNGLLPARRHRTDGRLSLPTPLPALDGRYAGAPQLGSSSATRNEDPHPQAATTFGLFTSKPAPMSDSL